MSNPKKNSEEEQQKHRNFWQGQIKQWQESQMTASMYCKEHQLGIHQFKYWQYQFAPETKKKRHKLKRPLFSEVKVTGGGHGLTRLENSLSAFELTIGDKIKLQVPPQFDEASLKRLLNCLGAN